MDFYRVFQKERVFRNKELVFRNKEQVFKNTGRVVLVIYIASNNKNND